MGAIKTKSKFRIEIKAISEQGTFEGLLSPYGNVDLGDDIVEPGAYTKTLKDQGLTRPLLWFHKADQPIGEITLEDRPDGLYCKGRLLMELPEAKKAYVLIKAKIVKGLSIGYETIKGVMQGSIRHLKEIKLREGSIVLFPMNELALINEVKGELSLKDDFNEELVETQTLDAFYQMQSALYNALCSVIWADMTRDEKIAACETILQQFSDAFSAFFPAYLDTLTEVYGIETMSAGEREQKQGAAISAANAERIRSCIEILTALLSDKAGLATLTTKAAESKPEPVRDHSAELAPFIQGIRSLIPN